MKTNVIEKTELDRVVELMCLSLELKPKSEQNVKQAVKNMGIKGFFESYMLLKLNYDEMERIKALKVVIENKEREIDAMEGGGLCGN